MDKEAWQATIYGVIKESDTTWQLNNKKPIFVTQSRVFLKVFTYFTSFPRNI